MDTTTSTRTRRRRPGGRPGQDEVEERLRSLRDAIRAAQGGDFSVRLPTNGEGTGDELLEEVVLAFNALLERNEDLVSELDRVSQVAGIEGRISERASLDQVSGSWAVAVGAVNTLVESMAQPTLEATRILGRVAAGDLSSVMPVQVDGQPLRGEFLHLGTTVNEVVDRLRTVSSRVSSVVREIGTEGKLGTQASVEGLTGTWKGLVDDVNLLASNLTAQVRNIAQIATAIANGDLSQKITVEAKGEFLELKSALNSSVEQVRSFAAEVTKVAREVGAEGRLGAQADVRGVSGTWKDLTDSVNMLAGNLTDQVRNIAVVATAIANGDLSQKISVEARGEILELKNTINSMVDRLQTFASEVTRVAREVGTEGELGGQADVKGVSGTWKDLTDNVNLMARNLTDQVRGIAKVVTAVATGDLSQKFVVKAKGEIAELADTINNMTEVLRTFAAQVTTVAHEVGIEGKLGGQANVPGVSGTWRDLTDNVNIMASNLTSQVRGIARVVTAVANGDLAQKLVLEVRGEIAALADTINDMTDTLRTFADQVTTVAREVGIEGKLGGQARVPGAAGTWKDLTESVNVLAGNLTSQVRNIALVTTAVANGDLSRKISVEAKGEILELKDTINDMVEQLRTFASEVTRVAREVGTDGQLGGQARVPGVSGTWKDLTDNVNVMASNLTDQVRGIGKVVTAVANGDLSKKLVLVARGEIAALADTINNMTDTLRTFADQVTTVAREVGIEGKLGGQAKVPGAAGTWRDLVDNVNQLAGNLTTQVRAISEVATAVTKGDLTREIDVGAQGEVLSLKDTINQMIDNLRDTTRTNKEQDWLKSNLARFSNMMQGQRSIEALGDHLMSELTPAVAAHLGTFFVIEEGEEKVLLLQSTYGYTRRKNISNRYALGEGLVGQAALEKKTILLTRVPEDYVPISSSLGEAPARNIVLVPILFEDRIRGVIELGSFEKFNAIQLNFLEQLGLTIGAVLNMISSTRRTEELLQQLKRSNAELETRSRELEEKAEQLEAKNREIAEASASLEEKASQLALVSKYKTEFLANMSHELRTPLNSIMVLAQLLADNPDGKLSPTQVEYARTVYSSGKELLALIDQILDLSKIEAGKMEIERRQLPLEELRAYAQRRFRPVAEKKDVEFKVSIDPAAPEVITTDPQRLKQILKNLLSNAFKFTETGKVEMRMSLHTDTSGFRAAALREAPAVLAFAIRDTGIGVSPEKQRLIFEAFQQADSSTSRVYGGTGLGLTISRELSQLLGGEIQLESRQGEGSTFTLFLPLEPGDQRAHVEEVKPLEPLEEEEEEPPEETAVSRNFEGKRILVVDDDVRNLFAVSALLERYGAEVRPAGSAKEAFEILDQTPNIAVVLMDMMMPEMDGYEATRRLRADPRYDKLPIIALTAKAMPGDKERALEAGCDDFVPKPIERDRLIEVLENTVGAEKTA